MVRFFLILIARHKCSMFDINLVQDRSSILELIDLLSPHIFTLRNHCTSCHSFIFDIFIADIAHLLVRNKNNKWTVAIDMNVYSKNQQFRLFNCVKYGKANPLLPSIKFPFKSGDKLSDYDVLQKSIITFIESENIPKILFNTNRFLINHSILDDSVSIDSKTPSNVNIKLLNDLIGNLQSSTAHMNTDKDSNPSNIQIFNHSCLSDNDIQTFVDFVQNMITCDSSHRGYIHSCVRGSINKNLLFFNISGEYRYCPKKQDHHQRNSVAFIIDTKNYIYRIRCKDTECDNSNLNWKKIN